MTLHFVDYHGPHGLFVATGDEIVSFESEKGALSLVSGSIQAGIGDTASAEAVEAVARSSATVPACSQADSIDPRSSRFINRIIPRRVRSRLDGA